jgi:hypothetical protein
LQQRGFLTGLDLEDLFVEGGGLGVEPLDREVVGDART